jgi:transcription elongation factor GreA
VKARDGVQSTDNKADRVTGRGALTLPLSPDFLPLYNVLERSSVSPNSASFFSDDVDAMSDPLAKIKQKLQQELDALEHELSVELPKEIAVARAHGDLSENAEYKFAKERQGYVNAKIGQLKKRMGDLGMLNLSNIPKDRAGYGSRIVVMDLQRSVELEYKLVSSEEADVEQGLISTTSPIGRALLNRRVGDEVQVATPNGKKEFEVVRLVTIHEDA